MKSRTPFHIIMFMPVSMLVIWMVLNDGHDWRDDFAMYVSQAQSVLDGSVAELYAMNVYSMDHSEAVLGPYLYQFGFPLLLVPVLALFGLNFFALKWFCSMALVLSIPLMFRLFRPHFRSGFYPSVIVALIAFHSAYIIFCDSILSDLPFLCFSLLALVLISKRATVLNQIVLGLVIYFCYLTRDIGIVLLPALLSFQVVSHLSITRVHDFQKRKFIPYLMFLLFFLIAAQLLPLGQENHLHALFSDVSKESIIQNLEYYETLVNQFLRIGTNPSFPMILLAVLAIIGGISASRKSPHLTVYLILSVAILTIWPFRQGIRFLFPLLPILVFFIVNGTVVLFDRPRLARYSLRAFFSLVLLWQMWFNAKEIHAYSITDSNACYTPEMRQIYSFMKNELPKDRIVVNYYPRVLRLFTGMNAIRVGQWEFEGSNASYLQTGKAYVDSSILERYDVVFETEHEIILGKKRP